MEESIKQSNHRVTALLAGAVVVIIAFLVYKNVSDDRVSVQPNFRGEIEKRPHSTDKTVSNYLSARFASQQGELGDALRYLDKTIDPNAKESSLAEDAYRISLGAGDIEAAVRYAKKMQLPLVRPLPLSPEIIEAVIAVKKGKVTESEKLLGSLRQNGFEAIIIELMKAWLDDAQDKPLKVNELKQILASSGEFKPLIKYQLAILFHHSSAKVGPQQAEMKKLANRYFNELSKQPTLPHHMALVMGAYYYETKQIEEFQALQARYRDEASLLIPDNNAVLQTVDSPAHAIAEVFFGISNLLISVEALEMAWVPLNVATYLKPDFASANFLKAQLFEKAEKIDDAISLYDDLKTSDSYRVMANLRLANLYEYQERHAKALQVLNQLEINEPPSINIMLTKADLLRKNNHYKPAIEAYSAALETVKTLEPRHWPILYSRAISYERSDQWPLAEADFQHALKLVPNQPDVLNYLGYSWLLQNKNIVQAKEMIERAIRARPRDAHIIDSMGWALYLLGEYQQASLYLERALNLAPSDATVNDHLGDVYWKLGYKTQAKFQWKKALAFEPEEEGQAEAIEKKLEVGLIEVPQEDVKPNSVESVKTIKKSDNADTKNEITAPSSVEDGIVEKTPMQGEVD